MVISTLNVCYKIQHSRYTKENLLKLATYRGNQYLTGLCVTLETVGGKFILLYCFTFLTSVVFVKGVSTEAIAIP